MERLTVRSAHFSSGVLCAFHILLKSNSVAGAVTGATFTLAGILVAWLGAGGSGSDAFALTDTGTGVSRTSSTTLIVPVAPAPRGANIVLSPDERKMPPPTRLGFALARACFAWAKLSAGTARALPFALSMSISCTASDGD